MRQVSVELQVSSRGLLQNIKQASNQDFYTQAHEIHVHFSQGLLQFNPSMILLLLLFYKIGDRNKSMGLSNTVLMR